MVELYKPQSLKEALELLSFSDCTIFAGGTDLMVKKKQWAGVAPSFEKPVMFISELQELKRIAIDQEHLIIGASCTFSELINSELLPDYFKTVFLQVASPGIRNIATIGGNICNASPAGDCIPLLYAMDASIEIQSSCRKHELPIEEFITGPGQNIIKPGELLTYIKVPIRSFNITAYRKVGTRKSTALSKLSFVGLANVDDNGIRDVRIAFGAVAPTVVRSRDIEEEIISMINSNIIDIDEIVSDYNTFIKPINDQRSTAVYRKEACKRLIVDFLVNCVSKEESKVLDS